MAALVVSLGLIGKQQIHASPINLIGNPGFSQNASSYTVFPGYSNGGNPNPSAPTDWNIGNPGVNGADTGVGNVFGPANVTIDNLGNSIRDFGFAQSAGNSIGQSVAVAAGTTYYLTFDAAARNGYGNNVHLDVVLNDGGTNSADTFGGTGNIYDTRTGSGIFGAGTTIIASTAQFTEYSIIFTTSASAGADGLGSVDFLNSGGGVDNTIDVTNVSLTAAVPEPSSLVALCGLGAMGLFVIARRRRKA